MMKKSIFVPYLFLCFCSVTNAASYTQDIFEIYNNTDGNIFIEVEFLEGSQELEPGDRRSFDIRIDELRIGGLFYDFAYNFTTTMILVPNEQMLFFTFWPWPPYFVDGRNPYDIMREIPIYEVLKMVMKSLKITNEQDDLLFTLEDIKEESLLTIEGRPGGRVFYILRIDDKAQRETEIIIRGGMPILRPVN